MNDLPLVEEKALLFVNSIKYTKVYFRPRERSAQAMCELMLILGYS